MLTTLINGDIKPRGTRSARRSESFYRKLFTHSKNNFGQKTILYTWWSNIIFLGCWGSNSNRLLSSILEERIYRRPIKSHFGSVVPDLGKDLMVQGMTTSLKQRVFCKNLLNKIPSFTAHTDCKIHNWPRTSIFKSESFWIWNDPFELQFLFSIFLIHMMGKKTQPEFSTNKFSLLQRFEHPLNSTRPI